MATITIRASETQLNELKERAAEKNMTLSEYILTQLFPNDIEIDLEAAENQLTIARVIHEITTKVSIGEEFQIPSLFPTEIWHKFTNTVTVGRTFRISSKDPQSAVSKVVDFVRKDSGSPAVYRRIG